MAQLTTICQHYFLHKLVKYKRPSVSAQMSAEVNNQLQQSQQLVSRLVSYAYLVLCIVHKVLDALLVVGVAPSKSVVSIVSEQHQDGVVCLTATSNGVDVGRVVTFIAIHPAHGLQNNVVCVTGQLCTSV